jgi:transposase InsO family protein
MGRALCSDLRASTPTIRKDLLHRRSWPTKQEARTATFDYIESFYNRERRHSTIDYLSRSEYERRFIEGTAKAA